MGSALVKAWQEWVGRMLPAGLDPEAEVRARFFVQGWVLAIFFDLIAATVYVPAGIWSQVVNNGVVALLGVGLLWLHRRGSAFERLGQVSLLLASLEFGLGTLLQRPPDYSSLALMLTVPLLAAFILGRRRALPWVFLSSLWSALIFRAADRGWVLDYVDPDPTVAHVVNFTVAFLLMWLFASAFDAAGTRTIVHLRATDRARRAFLANISHEIRTPMNGVLGMTEVLLQEPAAAPFGEQLRTIQRSGQTMVSLINDLLDLSKIEAGKLALEEGDFSLDLILADVQALYSPGAESKGLSLEVVKAPDLPARLRGDGIRLGQVLNNLVSNAVKFTPAGGVRLEVTRVAQPGPVRLGFSVTDTGLGIPAEALPRLFNAFQQGDASSTRRHGGTGLGLALSQQLVALMGGQIEVVSAPGQGSRFHFEVAFAEARTPWSESGVVAVPPAGQRRPVLVVDDNPVNLTVAMRLVEKAGYPVEAAVNGRLALEAVQRGGYSVVLMDCHMPEMDGFEATARIRALEGLVARTPIVAVTASAMPDELAACRRVGMNSVLVKPVTFAALCEVLAAHAG